MSLVVADRGSTRLRLNAYKRFLLPVSYPGMRRRAIGVVHWIIMPKNREITGYVPYFPTLALCTCSSIHG
jgi:hypothetical protein